LIFIYYIVPLLITLLISFSYPQVSIYSLFGIAFSISLAFQLFHTFDKEIPIKRLIAFVATLQWVIAPLFSYYVDKNTKNIFMCFDSAYGASINVKAAKVVDDLSYIVKDDDAMKLLRRQVAQGSLDESINIDTIKTSINFGALKSMMTAVTPHHITAKIEKTLAQRMAGYGKVNVQQAIILFVSIFGAILLGGLIIYLMMG